MSNARRIGALLLFAGAVACGGADDGGTKAEEAPRPVPGVKPGAQTVVVVVLDSVRKAELTPYGGPAGTTPNLAALAREGVVFQDCVTVSTGANGGLASLLTGLYAETHGVGSLSDRGQHRLAEGRETIVEAFHERGYATLGIVSLPQLAGSLSGLAQGFDQWISPGLGEDWRDAQQVFLGSKSTLQTLFAGEGSVFALIHFADASRPDDALADFAAPFLLERLTPFRGDRPQLAQVLDEMDGDSSGALRSLHTQLARQRGSGVHSAFRAALHAGQLAFVDHHLGELRELLREYERWDDALVVVCSTRGSLLTPPKEAGGPAFLPDLVQTPLVVRFPGSEDDGRSVEGLVQPIDVAATLSELYDLGLDVDGTSLLDGLRGEPSDDRIGFCEDATLARRAAFESELAVEEHSITGTAAYRRDGSPLGPQPPEPEAARAAELREALVAFRIPAVWTLRSGTAVDVQWTFTGGYSVEASLVGADGGSTRTHGLGGNASVPDSGGALVIEGSRRDLPMRLRLVREGGLSEDDVWVGDRPLSEVALPRIPGKGGDWPLDAEGKELPWTVEVTHQSGTWWRVLVGADHGEAGRSVEVLVATQPSADLDEHIEWRVGADVEAIPLEGRFDAIRLRGKTPFEMQVKVLPRRDLALAVRVADELVPTAAMRYAESRFCASDELVLYVPDWFSGVTDALERPNPETLAPGTLALSRTGAGIPHAERAGLDAIGLEFVRKLGSRE